MAPSRSQLSLGFSESKASSTAASVTSVPAGAVRPSGSVTLMRTWLVARLGYVALSGTTSTLRRCAAVPTSISVMPNLKAGFARSTIAVGAW